MLNNYDLYASNALMGLSLGRNFTLSLEGVMHLGFKIQYPLPINIGAVRVERIINVTQDTSKDFLNVQNRPIDTIC